MSLSNHSLNFGEIRLGKTISRMFTINNHSELPTKFEFFNQPGNVFSFSKTKGQIPPLSNIRILVYFSPLHTVSYYERIFCVVKNHKLLYFFQLVTLTFWEPAMTCWKNLCLSSKTMSTCSESGSSRVDSPRSTSNIWRTRCNSAHSMRPTSSL